jgi:GPH family glycoside/pentoside/hexuronide:cation symporter
LFGDFGNDFTFILSSSFLLKFYTDIMNISAATVGVVMMLARLLDAVTDITMGRICDRARPTARGKFRPWILRMCIPVSVASFLIYQTRFATAPYGFRLAWFIITYLLWGSIFYTSINIPYGSMASVISDDAKDRQSLSTYRSLGSTFAGVIVGAGIPILAYEKRTVAGVELTEMVGERFTLIAGIFSILAIISYVICYVLTTERITSESFLSSARAAMVPRSVSAMSSIRIFIVVFLQDGCFSRKVSCAELYYKKIYLKICLFEFVNGARSGCCLPVYSIFVLNFNYWD